MRQLGILGIVFLLSACSGERPKDLGQVDGKLKGCGEKPNCVSTVATDDKHKISPYEFRGNAQEVMKKLKKVIGDLPRTKIVSETENYLHVEFTSAIFRFVDDVEFLIDEKSQTVHFRSASRTGYSDLGANRQRMEEFRVRYYQA